MSATVIQADYEQLAEIARRFATQAESYRTMHQQLRQRGETLVGSGWQGSGAAAFAAEMDGTALPAIQRLGSALQQASAVTLQISATFQEAEEAAALLFGGSGSYGDVASKAADQLGKEANSRSTTCRPYGEYEHLKDIPPLVLGSDATHQDLAAAIEQMYRINDDREDRPGIDEPVKIVKIGPNDYVVLVAGTDAGNDANQGPNDWFANASSGRGLPSRYQLAVLDLIRETIPPGANINLAGHSQGGYVVMNLAGTQSLVDDYNITSVTTYGAGGNGPINPRLGPERYHNYVLSDDIIRAVENGRLEIPGLPIQPGGLNGINSLIGMPGSGGYEVITPHVIPEQGGHIGYHFSPHLATQAVPFEITEWNVVGSYEVGDQYFDNARIGWEKIHQGRESGNDWQIFAGGVDIAGQLAVTTSFAIIQNESYGLTQFLPESYQVEADRVFDQIGTNIAQQGPMSELLPDVWRGFWD